MDSSQTREAKYDLAASRGALAEHRRDCAQCGQSRRTGNPCPDGADYAEVVERDVARVRREMQRDAEPVAGQATLW